MGSHVLCQGWGQQEDCTRGGGAVLMFAHALVCAEGAGALMPPRDPGSIALASKILPASERENIQNRHTHTITVFCCILPS